MTKRFGRPPPSFDEAPAPKGTARQIVLPREGHALEGAYAASAARSEMSVAPYHAIRKAGINRGIFNAAAILFVWLLLATLFAGGNPF